MWMAGLLSVLRLSGMGYAQQSVQVTPGNAEIGKASLYKLEFVLPDSLPPTGAIAIVFPVEFDLKQITIGASGTIKGGFSTYVVSNEVLLVRKGRGKPHSAGERVDVWLSAVKNPNIEKFNYSTRIYIYRDGVAVAAQIKDNTYKPKANPRALRGSFVLTAKR